MDPTDLERRLGSALKARDPESVDAPPFDRVRPRVSRRRRHHRVAGALAAVAILGVGVTLWQTDGGDTPPGPHVRVPPAQTNDDGGSPPPGPPVQVPPTNDDRLGVDPVDLQMFVKDGVLSDVAMIDLVSGKTYRYAGSEHALGRGSISGALVTKECLVLWETGALTEATARTLSFKAPLGAASAPDLSLEASVGLGSILGPRRVVATEDGARVWIGEYNPTDGASRLELVDCTNGNLLSTVALTAEPGIRSSIVLGSLGDNAVVVRNWPDADEHVLLVAPSGEITQLPSMAPATFITAGAGRMLWSHPDGQLLVTDGAGRLQSTVESPVAGWTRWNEAGNAAGTNENPDYRTISLDGTRALVTLSAPEPEHDKTAIYLVDVTTGRTQRLDLGPGLPRSAVWSRDDRRIVGITGNVSSSTIVPLDAATGAPVGPSATVPSDLYFFGAG